MAKRSCDVVKNKELKIEPPLFEKTWFTWLENPQDWCISRQLWWGHRIPAYFVNISGEENLKNERHADGNYWISGRTLEICQEKAKAKFQNKTFTLELTDKIPFKEVYLHAMVRDAHGKKMSKSVGNVIDPTWVIDGKPLEYMQEQLKSGNIDYKDLEKALKGQQLDYPNGIPECGADAMRFALCAYTAQGKSINLDVLRVAGYRNFCNKLWNANKFARNCLGDFSPKSGKEKNVDFTGLTDPNSEAYKSMNSMNKWILSKLAKAVSDSNEGLATYNFPQTTTACYSFWLYELCDVYLEAVKPILYSKDGSISEREVQNTKFVLNLCLDVGLRLLAPIMPFITEELWQRLPRSEGDKDSIHISSYPSQKNFKAAELMNFDDIDNKFEFAYNAVKSIRSLRAEYKLTPKQNTEVFVKTSQKNIPVLEGYKVMIETLSNASKLEFIASGSQNYPLGCAVAIVNDECEIAILLKGIIDVQKEIQKLEKELVKNVNAVKALEGKMGKESYSKVPDHVKEKDAAKLKSSKMEGEKMKEAIESFKKMA